LRRATAHRLARGRSRPRVHGDGRVRQQPNLR